MADTTLKVNIDNTEYKDELEVLIEANKLLEEQLHRTGESLKLNNTQYEISSERLKKILEYMEKIGKAEGKITGRSNINFSSLDGQGLRSAGYRNINRSKDNVKDRLSFKNASVENATYLLKSVKATKAFGASIDRLATHIDKITSMLISSENKTVNKYTPEFFKVFKKKDEQLNLVSEFDSLTRDYNKLKKVENFQDTDEYRRLLVRDKRLRKAVDNSEYTLDDIKSASNKLKGSEKDSRLSKAFKLMSTEEKAVITNSLKAAGALAAYAAALVVAVKGIEFMYKAGSKAHDVTLKLQQSMLQYGDTAGDMGEASINVSNKLKEAKLDIKRWGEDINSSFEGFFNKLTIIGANAVNALDKLNSKIRDFDEAAAKKIADLAGNEYEPIGSSGKTSFSDTAKSLGLTDSEYAQAMANIVSTSRELGFSLKDLKELATNTIETAYEVSQRTGEQTIDVIEKIADAWQNGSNAASQYGVVVTDDVLAGWAALEKGIDIVNIKYSDAAIQGLRYELAMKQLANTNSKQLQENIKKWKEQGAIIQQNKNNLSAFEEVLLVSGYESTIPGISGKEVVGLTDLKEEAKDAQQGIKGTKDEIEELSKKIRDLKGSPLDIETKFLLDKNGEAFYSWMNDPPPIVLEADLSKMLEQFKIMSSYVSDMATGFAGGLTKGITSGWLSEKKKSTSLGINKLLNGGGGSNFGMTPLKNLSDILNGRMDNTTGAFGNLSTGPALDYTRFLGSLDNSRSTSTGLTILQQGGGFRTTTDPYEYISGTLTGKTNPLGYLDIAIEGQMDNTTGAFNIPNKKSNSTGAFKNSGNFGSNFGSLNVPSLHDSLKSIAGHKDGGISTKQHIANISEGNSVEAIIPLNSSVANPAYEQMADSIVRAMLGNASLSGDSTVINVAPNSTVIGDQAGLRKLAQIIEQQITLQKRNRGELDYGTRK